MLHSLPMMKSKSKTKTIVLTLPPETEVKIRDAARVHGLTAQAYIVEVLSGRLKAKLDVPPIKVGNPQL